MCPIYKKPLRLAGIELHSEKCVFGVRTSWDFLCPKEV